MSTNDYSTNIVYLSKEQYQELITNETLTVNGQTITYNDNDIYVTPQAEPITDVKLAGTSIGSNGVVNIPIASTTTLGVVKTNDVSLHTSNLGLLSIVRATPSEIKAAAHTEKPIVPKTISSAAFYGLAKAAGADMASIESTTLGIYPDTQKAAIQNMLGITDLISTEESSTATAAHALNSIFMMGGKLYKATAAIAIGDAVTEGENCEVVKADEVFVKNTDIASPTTAGIIKVSSNCGLQMGTSGLTGYITTAPAGDSYIKEGGNSNYCRYQPITPYNQHKSVFYGLSKVAGVDLANETVTLGTYPETSKTAIRSLIGAAAAADIPSVPVQDVQVNGTSILNQGVANIPVASSNNLGVVKIDINSGIGLGGSNRTLFIQGAENADIKIGTNAYKPIVPITQHISIFYGLSKLAGIDLANETVTVGTYPETSKTAIRTMIGAGTPLDVQINGTSIINNGVANIPFANTSTFGVVKVAGEAYGLMVSGTGIISLAKPTDAQIQGGTNNYRPIVPSLQHAATFYGLAKAAGDTTMFSSSNAVGTYTDDAKLAIQTMLGIDLQSIASEVEIPLVETVEGTTPTITGQPNVRYVCGEVSTISITPPSAGSIDVIFESGSTAAVLTVPNTVKWPAWFDATALEADTTYEILITDGVYGSVMTWAN